MSTKNFDAVVIGAGPGGYHCAIRLAQLGKKTAIIEKEYIGGVCLNVGCIPSKALIHAAGLYQKMKHDSAVMGFTVGSVDLDFKKLIGWKNDIVKKLTGGVSQVLKANGVETISGTASFKDAKTLEVKSKDGVQTVTAKDIVIATGSRVFSIPSLPINGKNIVSSTEAMELPALPKKLIVIGGGFIGLEIGTVYAKLGVPTTIIEGTDQLLMSVERDLVAVVEKKLRKMGVEVLLNTKAIGLKEKDPANAKTLHLDVDVQGKTQTLEADCILVSIGRKPNSDGIGLEKVGVKIDPRGNVVTDQQGKTNVAGVYAIGDVSGAPQLAHKGMMDGLLVAATIAGEKSFKDYKTVPWAVFCDPEIATTGLTEAQAKEKGIAYKVGKFPFAASGRALSTNDAEGFIKVLISEKDETIIGCHIVGPEASNLIAEATLAIEMGACVEDVVRTIHTHPTLPEVFPEALEQAFGKSIHVFKPPSKRA